MLRVESSCDGGLNGRNLFEDFQGDFIPLADLRGEAQGDANVFALDGGQCAHRGLARGSDKRDIAGHHDLRFLIVGCKQVWRRQHIDIVLALNGLDQRTDIEKLLPAKGDRPADKADRQAAESERIMRQIVDQPKALPTEHHRAIGCEIRGRAKLYTKFFVFSRVISTTAAST